MHILATTSASIDDLAEPVDLGQTPADIVALSFTDSDLSGLASAWQQDASSLPSMRLASLRELRHPMSVDIWIDSVAMHARVILVRILGGYDWWRYGCDRLAALAREHGIKLVMLPGECRDVDERLVEASTVPRQELDGLLAYFREGGPANMRALVGRLAQLAGQEAQAAPARPCRGPGSICRARGSSIWPIFGSHAPPALPLSRYSSTAPCCSPPMLRRSMHSARPSTREVSRLFRSSSQASRTRSPCRLSRRRCRCFHRP